MINKIRKVNPFIKPLLKLAGAVAFVAGIFYVGLEGPQIHHNYIRNKVGPSVVMITNLDQNSGGTGFLVNAASGKSYILTNAHICLGVKRPLIITFKDRRQVSLRIIEVSRDTDLCLIESVGNLPSLKLGSSLDIGDTIGIVGHPALMSLTLSRGELIEFTNIALPVPDDMCEAAKELGGPFKETGNPWYPCGAVIKGVGQTTAVILGGNSGSPVVNFYGHVVGIAFAGRGDSNWGLIVPLKDVQKFLAPY